MSHKRREGRKSKRERPRERARVMGTSRPSEENQEPRELWAEMSGLYRNEKLRGGRGLG